jgi:hypothetical protein
LRVQPERHARCDKRDCDESLYHQPSPMEKKVYKR